MKKNYLFHLNAILYALPAIAIAFAGLPLYVHAPDFYATVYGLSLATLGIILLVLRAIDAFLDPLIGALSDRFTLAREKILFIGCLLLLVGFWGIFHPPKQALLFSELIYAWLFFNIFLCTTGFSLVSINYLALASLWQGSDHERTLISSWREGLGLVGILLASSLPSVFGLAIDSGSAYDKLSKVLIALSLICALALSLWWKRTLTQRVQLSSGINVKLFNFSEILLPLQNKWARHFFALYGFSVFASAIPAVLVIFYVRDFLGLYDYFGSFLGLYFLSGVLSLPFWSILAKHRSKLIAWRLSMLLAGGTFIWAFFLTPGAFNAYLVICALSGIALGADLSLPPSMLADQIAATKDEQISSRYFAILTFLNKAMLALATGFALPLVAYFGLVAGQPATKQAAFALTVTYCLIPSVLKLFTAYLGKYVK